MDQETMGRPKPEPEKPTTRWRDKAKGIMNEEARKKLSERQKKIFEFRREIKEKKMNREQVLQRNDPHFTLAYVLNLRDEVRNREKSVKLLQEIDKLERELREAKPFRNLPSPGNP